MKPIEVVSKPIERMPLNLNPPRLEGLESPEWKIVTPENQESVWKSITEKGYNPVIFGLTDGGYKDLASLMAKIRNHIQTQREIIEKYKEYYEPKKINKDE